MNGMKQIFCKEMARIFRDRKMIFAVFLLPVLIMVLLLTVINNLQGKMQADIEEHRSVVWIRNEPESFRAFLQGSGLPCSVKAVTGEADGKEARREILNGKADLYIEFPEDFDGKVGKYQVGDDIPDIHTYYNPSENYSSQAYQTISAGALESYRQTLLAQRAGTLEAVTVFTVNKNNESVQIQDEEKASGQALGMMLPYFITLLLFAGAMGIGTDMIAGEKERGTMASLLVAPVKRSSIVLGKVFALMTVSGISSIIYVAGMVICMPFMMDSMSGLEDALSLKLSAPQILMMGLLLLAIAFLYAAVVALISVFAKTTKEASTYIMPVYMIILVIGLLTMFRMGDGSPYDYYIPFYNSAVALQSILTHELSASQFAVTLAETLLLGGALTILIARAFNNEKVMAL